MFSGDGQPGDDFVLHVEEVAKGLSNRSAQRWLPVSASISWTLTRTRLPPR